VAVSLSFLTLAPVSTATSNSFGDSQEDCVSSEDLCSHVWTEGLRLASIGDFDNAAALFQQVFNSEQQTDYCRELDDLFQIVELQNAMKTETNPVLWSAYAEKLRRLYHCNGMFPECYEISKQIFSQTRTVTSGLEVVHLCLAFHQIDEALSFIKCLELRFARDSDALTAIAVAKCSVFLVAGKTETARGLVREICSDSIKTPEVLLQLAKIQAATRQHVSSIKSLTRCFESTPQSVLPVIKADVLNSPEFRPIVSAPQFKMAMETQSKQVDTCCAKARENLTNIVSVNR